MTTTTTGLHGITVEQLNLPAGHPFRAVCLCGWQSGILPARPHAVAAGDEHVGEQCSCGKPRAHLDADPDSQEWACRVPKPSTVASVTDFDQSRAEWARKPECPDWCMDNWCAVRPVLSDDRRVWQWQGFHIGEIRTVEADYGITTQVAIASSEDEPERVGILLRLLSREDASEELRTFLTDGEAAGLHAALGRFREVVDLYRDDAAGNGERAGHVGVPR